MQIRQLNPYSMNVPKLEASVMVSKELGMAAILSWLPANHTVDQKPCGSVAMEVSAIAEESPKTISNPTTAITIEMIASVQMARWGLRFLEWSMPKCSGTSWSLPMA